MPAATVLLHAGCAAAYVLLAALVLLRAWSSRTALYLAGTSLVTASWAGAVALDGPGSAVTAGLELARAVAWYGFALHLLLLTTPSAPQLRRVFAPLFLLALLVLGLALLGTLGPQDRFVSLGSVAIDIRLGLAVANILLLENLYLNTPADRRWNINLLCIAVGGIFVFDIILYSDAVLFRRISPALFAGRAVVTAGMAPLLALAAARNRRWRIDIHVSRSVVFHSATLVASGVFLLGLAAAGEVFRRFGADWGTLAEISLIFGGVVAIAVLLSSGSARSRIRFLLVDHFFSSRYDYRREWMRCIAALSTPDDYVPLHTRVIRAVAAIVDSPAGMLFLRAPQEAVFHWAGSWNLPATAAAIPADHPLIPALRGGEWVAEADPAAPPWIEEIPGLWLAVPLSHAGGLIGVILVARPRAAFRLDREVYNLLRTVGRQVAVFVAEQRAAEGLIETRQLREYGQRFAFVAHDIKNVASQLALLLANAEHHLANPEFQKDMLGTVRVSVQKISALLARLNAPQSEPAPPAVAPLARIEAIVETLRQRSGMRPAIEHDGRTGSIAMPPASFDAIIAHLLDNAMEAATAGEVHIRLRHETRRVLIDIVDHGPGMTPEFIRDELFRPFRSSKTGGFGIGAFQARELVREAGGELLVMSRPGLGTTMRLLLPLSGGEAEGAATLSA